MHQVLENISAELELLIATINSSVPNNEPFGIAHANWTFPGVTKNELAEVATKLVEEIRAKGRDALGSNEKLIADYVRRLAFLRTNVVPNIWGNGAAGVPSYMQTMDALARALEPALAADLQAEAARTLKQVSNRLRAMEARLNDLEPRASTVSSMIERIQDAHEAANQLPADLETLAEDREKLRTLLKESEKDRSRLIAIREAADGLDKALKASADQANAVVARCESAYSAATSQGLAAAFSERSKALDLSMWAWVVGLGVALAVGATTGSAQLRSLSDLMQRPTVSVASVVLNLLLALLSVGAPVWFSWLATKQIGHRFRLSEDYAFKASVSRAYEGYRKEASRFGKEMEEGLLTSALQRLDELPLRLIESATHSSPLNELLSSELVKDAVRTVPGFVTSVKTAASDALASVRRSGDTVNEIPVIKADPP